MFMSIAFLLYGRSYCHLCDDMRIALEKCLPARSIPFEMVDVDDDPDLVARYDELVPVLMGCRPDGSLQQLCHYFLDTDAVIAFIATSQAYGGASSTTESR